MPIPALPLFKHRDTVVTPADQNQFVTQFENTMDTMSNDVIPALNLAITDINGKVITATTARDEAEDARDISVAAKDEALTAVATLQEGAIDDTTIAPNKAFSNSYVQTNYYDKDEINNNFIDKTTDQDIDSIKTFIKSPIVPTPTMGTQAVNKEYVDVAIALKTIATGTATFNSTTNNINLTGIGIGVEIGDVIQISGAVDVKNNSEFTIEVITDNDNIIVNQAHANKGTTKNVANRSGDTGVTVKLLAKWYNAPTGLGQDWVNVTSSRIAGSIYSNNTNRSLKASISIYLQKNVSANFSLNGSAVVVVSSFDGSIVGTEAKQIYSDIAIKDTYSISSLSTGASIYRWWELR